MVTVMLDVSVGKSGFAHDVYSGKTRIKSESARACALGFATKCARGVGVARHGSENPSFSSEDISLNQSTTSR
jgi:hypothetical protein